MLSPTQRAMIAALCNSDPVPTRQLVDVVYGYLSDGGPADAGAEVRKQMLKIRHKLAPLGVEIETVGDQGSHHRGYRVRPDHVGRIREALSSGT